MNDKILKKKQKGLNRHWKNFVDKDYLGSHNLERGEEMLLTIEKFEGEEMVQATDGTKSSKMVLYFKEDKPKMILNITNASTLGALYGQHPEGWIGKQVQIYSASVKAFGKTQDALRIRDFIPKREVDTDKYVAQMEECTELDSLKSLWSSFAKSVQNDPILMDKKNEMKDKLSTNENN